jgi:uncharacterized protein YbjQ (UPF0145 family)
MAAAVLVAIAPAQARDERLLMEVNSALSSPQAQDRFDDTVQFYWDDQVYPQALQSFGIHTAGRKTWALTKTDQEACDRAFLSALIALRDRAKEAGANAVVHIKSIYLNREFRSETQYECRAGHVATGVTLEGRLVKLPPPGVTTWTPVTE